MANTLGTPTWERGVKQFQGLFSTMFVVSVLVSDQDAIADDVSVSITCIVRGVALGDIVLFSGFTKSQADANAAITHQCFVSATDTVTLRLTNIDEVADAYDADTLTDGYLKLVIGRPNW